MSHNDSSFCARRWCSSTHQLFLRFRDVYAQCARECYRCCFHGVEYAREMNTDPELCALISLYRVRLPYKNVRSVLSKSHIFYIYQDAEKRPHAFVLAGLLSVCFMSSNELARLVLNYLEPRQQSLILQQFKERHRNYVYIVCTFQIESENKPWLPFLFYFLILIPQHFRSLSLIRFSLVLFCIFFSASCVRAISHKIISLQPQTQMCHFNVLALGVWNFANE